MRITVPTIGLHSQDILQVGCPVLDGHCAPSQTPYVHSVDTEAVREPGATHRV